MKKFILNASRVIGETEEGKTKYFTTAIGLAIKYDNGCVELKFDYLPTDMQNTKIFISQHELSAKKTQGAL